MSILPATIFMGLIGLMVSGATGTADPIKVFSSAVDNTPLLVITLLFIAFAQVTTNVLNNVVPPAYVLMDVFKLSFKKSAVLVGLLASMAWLVTLTAPLFEVFEHAFSGRDLIMLFGGVFADFVAPYVGRLNESGRDAHGLIDTLVALQQRGGPTVLAASIRDLPTLGRLITQGVGAVTLRKALLDEALADEATLGAVAQFEAVRLKA